MMRTKAPIPKFELQLFFMSYCPNAQIDVAKGSKLIKESPGLATAPHLTLKELEMIFAKVLCFVFHFVSFVSCLLTAVV